MHLPAFITIAACLLTWQTLAAQTPTPVVIGWGPSPDVPQIAQAFDKNLWKEQNVEPKMVPFATGRESFEALIGGGLDLAIMAEFPPVSGALRNLKFSIVAAVSKYDGMRVIAKSATPITDLKQLAGKKVATPIGTNVHFAVADALKTADVKVELVNVGPSDIVPALIRGDVDAASMFPSGYLGAKKALGAQYQEVGLPNVNQIFILVASEKFASSNPDAIKRVLATLLKGEELVVNNPKDSQEATARYVKNAVPLDNIRTAWPDYTFKITLDNATLDLMTREGRWIREMGFVKEGEPSRQFYKGFVLKEPLTSIAPDRVSLD
jgi:NitT/TauT family transport system substrate-binding protein